MNRLNIFSQLIKLIPRTLFTSHVRDLGADFGVRRLDSWTWFGSLLFSQYSGQDSIRALEKIFECTPMLKLGFSPLRRSTFSDANRGRPVELLERVFKDVQAMARSAPRRHRFSGEISGQILLLDSTFIELCLGLCPWAGYRRSSQGSRYSETKDYGGLKLHTAVDLAGVIPEIVVIQDGTERVNSDVTVAKSLEFSPGTLLVMDRGYAGAEHLNQLTQKKVGFVTRVVSLRVKFRRVSSRAVNRTQGLVCDQEVYFSGEGTKAKYAGTLRRIKYREPDTGKEFIFLTNRFDLDAYTICELYRARWQVESFFKTLKQHFRIKKFLGLNKNAVKAQILTALIAYLLVTYVKLTSCSSIAMNDLMATVATMLLVPFCLWKILESSPKRRGQAPPIQMPIPI